MGEAAAAAESAQHPVRLVVRDDLRRTRLTVLFRLLLAIPHFFWQSPYRWALVRLNPWKAEVRSRNVTFGPLARSMGAMPVLPPVTTLAPVSPASSSASSVARAAMSATRPMLRTFLRG